MEIYLNKKATVFAKKNIIFELHFGKFQNIWKNV